MITPYLTFGGDCEAAFLWYAELFEGKIQHLVKYGDMPENPDVPMAEAQKDKVMHAQLLLTEAGGISGADATWPIETGSSMAIHAHLENEELAHHVFDGLSEGGTILGALATNPPPDDNGISGSVTDKYGFTWIISALKSA